MRTRLIATVAVFLTLGAAARAQPCLPPTPVPDFTNAVIKTTDLGNHIYMLEGVGGTVGGNVTVAVGEDGVIMVDNMFTQMYGKLTSSWRTKISSACSQAGAETASTVPRYRQSLRTRCQRKRTMTQ